MRIRQGDLVLLKYPFSNLKEFKVRPALVVSNDKLNKNSQDCILVPLTTVIKKDDHPILINQEDLSSGKLIKESRIRADKIFTGSRDLIFLKIGSLNKRMFLKVKKKIFEMLD